MTAWRWRAAFALAAVTTSAAVLAQDYPSRPIQMIVPLAAGSAGDTMLRLLAEDMGKRLGQSIVIDNQPGAAGLIGADRLVRAAPDGYSIGGLSDSVVNYAPALAAKSTFDPLVDVQPVGHVAGVSWALVVNPKLGPRSVAELVALMKSKPDGLHYASAGNGSPHHVVMELFKAATGTQALHVPYRGATQATMDVVGGQVPMMFSAVSVVAPYVKDGRLRALSVLGDTRSNLLPGVPTMAEAGVPDFTFETWVGVYAPKGTPAAVVSRLNAEIGRSLANPQLRDKLIAMGFEPGPSTPGALAARTRDGLRRVSKVIHDANIKAD